LATGGFAAQAEIVIGAAGAITGSLASLGIQQQRGAEQAVEDINAQGGLLGEEVRLEFGDDQCDPRQAVSVANRFLNEGIEFVAGHLCSGASIAARDVYVEEGVLMISPSATAPEFTEAGYDTVFRVAGRDDQQGAVAADFIAQNHADANIAIVHDKSTYGQGLAEVVQEQLNAAGIDEVLFESITAGESDYSALVTRLKAENTDVLYYGGYHAEAGLITRQLRAQGMDTILIGGDGLANDEYWSITGDTGAGTFFTFAPDPRQNPEAADVVERLRSSGFEPDGFALHTYAAIQVYAQAVEAAGTTDVDAVVEQLRSNSFDTVVGERSFDEKGDITQPAYVIYAWEEGEFAELQ
ncbi:MAG TPA: branched-chain amino acid ABC transporter substrate-binding protein, partial [Alphaproteobacteria bacterium]|nr:branched-chain amino acid ABC transporter substrate-binding protein [Alphaproteobacteria bacterium]